MKYDYQYKITFKLDEPFDVNYIKKMRNQHPQSKILVEVQNTKGITSSMIRELDSNMAIRIAGGFNEDRCQNGIFKGNDYKEAVIYTRNETIKILETIEKIEAGIDKNWSSIQIVLYVYNRLKREIMYDPKFKQKYSSEIRSLRGLITKQTVCAGYAIIFKEFMDRHGIECEYVEGHTSPNRTGGHSWNIVIIDGKKYPIDLTWDNTRFRSGDSKTFDWLAQDVKTFSQSHYPSPMEKTQNYEQVLSQIDPNIVKQVYLKSGMARTNEYTSTTYYGTRSDGSKYIVAQIGNNKINNKNYYRYYYVEISKDGKRQLPLILYSDTNVTHLVEAKKFGKPIPPNYEKAVDDILFSKQNIADSLAKRTYYIGGVRKNEASNKLELVTSPQEIAKPEDKRAMFVFPTKRFTRSDGSVLIVQQMMPKPHKACGIDVMKYDILEMVNEDGREVLKRNTVFTERNFFKDSRQSMIDEYLSRERIDRKVMEAGGYIGYYDANGINTYNPDLVEFFKTSKNISLDTMVKKANNPSMSLPSFQELKDLASKYEIYVDSTKAIESDASKYKIRDIKSGQIQTDKAIVAKAMFANIWLTSAGITYYNNEERLGFNNAFNEMSGELYNAICNALLNSCKNKGVIDTVELFRNIENSFKYNYKYTLEVIVSLFRTQFQTQFINKLFLQAVGINKQGPIPEPLYTMSYAGGLTFNNRNSVDDTAMTDTSALMQELDAPDITQLLQELDDQDSLKVNNEELLDQQSVSKVGIKL